MRIHVLGLGAISALVSHHLRIALPRAYPITLIRRSKQLVTKGRVDDGVIRIENHGIVVSSTGYESEVVDEEELMRVGRKSARELRGFTLNMPEKPAKPMEPLHPIESLIITSKPQVTLQVLKKLQPRLSSDSTIVLLQEGLGVYEYVIQEIFRNPETRPHFIIAFNTHGAWQKNFRQVVHAGIGEIEFGIVPDPQNRDFEASLKDAHTPIQSRSLRIDDIAQPDDPHFSHYRSLRLTVAALSAMEALNAKWKPIQDVHVAMRRKLAVNAVIYPMTALMGCRNGDIFREEASRRIARRICSEASAAYACELISSTHSMLERLGDEHNEGQMSVGRLPRELEYPALEEECQRVVAKTKGNISSMLKDVRQGKPTEIDFINGYLIRLSNAHGRKAPANSMLLDLIKMRSSIPLDQML